MAPIDAAYIFAPTQDLPDEPLHGVQRRVACAKGAFGRNTNFARDQQAAVEIGRDDGVIEKGLAHLHGVLIITIKRQASADEMVQRLQRIRPRHRPAEGREIAEMVGEALAHERHDFARDGVRFEALALGRRKAGGQGLAVLLVEIPLAALGLVALHQEARFAAHLPIEELHAIGFALIGPARETTARAEKPIILADVHRQAKLR